MTPLDRVPNSHLELRLPPGVEVRQQGFEHRSLEAVVDPRARAREVPDAEVSSQRDADRREDLEARMLNAGLDPADVGGVDVGGTTQDRERHARVEADPPDVLPDPGLDPATAPSCLAPDRGRRHCHAP
jgi:hypothetical protein